VVGLDSRLGLLGNHKLVRYRYPVGSCDGGNEARTI
jgi:hypothetical protein